MIRPSSAGRARIRANPSVPEDASGNGFRAPVRLNERARIPNDSASTARAPAGFQKTRISPASGGPAIVPISLSTDSSEFPARCCFSGRISAIIV
ncbi:hypothetical protein JCM9957A_21010 [Kineosporia succinea]